MTIRPPEDTREHALNMAVKDVRLKLEKAQFYIDRALGCIHQGEIGKELTLDLRTGAAFLKSALEVYHDLKRGDRG